MKNKRFLLWINLVLGSLSMLLVGCHTQKKAVQPAEPEPAEPATQEQVTEPNTSETASGIDDRVICKYGVPADLNERPKLKYGTPNGRVKE